VKTAIKFPVTAAPKPVLLHRITVKVHSAATPAPAMVLELHVKEASQRFLT